MSAYDKLIQALVAAGFKCHIVLTSQVESQNISEGPDSIFRLDIAERRIPPFPGDRSFGVKHIAPSEWTIILWSGRNYKYMGEDIIQLCLDLMAPNCFPKGRTPSILPNQIISKYEIKGINC